MQPSSESDAPCIHGPRIVVRIPEFAELLRQRVEQQELDLPGDDLFDLSPLTSPEPTPPSSPISLPNRPIDEDTAPQPLDGSIVEDPTPQFLDDDVIWFAEDEPNSAPSTPHSIAFGPSPFTAKERRTARKKLQSRANRKRKREDRPEFGGPEVRPSARKKHYDNSNPLYTDMKTTSASVASTGYVALDRPSIPFARRVYRLDELVGDDSLYKFELHRWDGRTPIPIIDLDGRIIALLAGHPEDPNWPQVQLEAASLLDEARRTCRKRKTKTHRRGAFPTMRCGVSHGSGQVRPMNLRNTKLDQQVLDGLNSQDCFKRLAGFCSNVFASWAPDLYTYYNSQLGRLFEHDKFLKPTFKSVFTATTYNLGPRTACFPHIDKANLPFGWCCVTALGRFDPTKGGHIVFWECGLVVEFPPGSTILLPSAVLHHSNTPVAGNETRSSFTQYSSGGLFRWVDHGFMKTNDYRESLDSAELAELDKANANRWMLGLSLLPRLPSVSTS